jgi:hypothetical protein
MTNPKEKKVACFGGKALYIVFNYQHPKGAKALKHSNRVIIEFAQKAIDKCAEVLMDEFIYTGLFRVDIFEQTPGGPLVVNEFESLDAAFYSSSRTAHEELSLTDNLVEYWKEIIYQQVICSRTH